MVKWVECSPTAGETRSKTQKIVFDASFLNTQYYKVRIKGKVEQSKERSSVFHYTLVLVAIEKGAIGLPSTTARNFYYYLHHR